MSGKVSSNTPKIGMYAELTRTFHFIRNPCTTALSCSYLLAICLPVSYFPILFTFIELLLDFCSYYTPLLLCDHSSL